MSLTATIPLASEISIQSIAQRVGGRLVAAEREAGLADFPLGRVRIDSRECRSGDVFWGLQGGTTHGSEFADDAFARGAIGVVTDDHDIRPPLGRWALVVEDTAEALEQLAAWRRARFAGEVIAITGSAGKTTTRQLIHAVLARRFSGTASPANYNNSLGVPLSMLRWEADDDYAVLELGASAGGEIARLAALAQPRIAAITNIGDAHAGSFATTGGVAKAKAELLAALPADGWAVLNGDDPRLRQMAADFDIDITWVGRGAANDLIASNVRYARGRLTFAIGRERITARVWGRHHLHSVLIAVAIGRRLGVSWSDIREALAEFEPPPMRCQVMPIGGLSVIDDTYNASPSATRAALELLREDDAAGRRIVVLGDMRELGAKTSALHRRAGDEVVTVAGAHALVACGGHATEVADGARRAGMPGSEVTAFETPDEALPHVLRLVRPGDAVLVKGSRAMQMERVVRALATAGNHRAA
jgi:UDP-N-acetylmuramoyl-tripeptide--D-alanyl-D-alanine ligase